MMYPLVREFAVDGIPETVTGRILDLARQPYYRWLANPVSDGELVEAYLANAIFDAHRDDPEFGYRFLADETRLVGHDVCDRTVCGSVGTTAGGPASPNLRIARPPSPAPRPATTWPVETSPRRLRTRSGSPT